MKENNTKYLSRPTYDGVTLVWTPAEKTINFIEDRVFDYIGDKAYDLYYNTNLHIYGEHTYDKIHELTSFFGNDNSTHFNTYNNTYNNMNILNDFNDYNIYNNLNDYLTEFCSDNNNTAICSIDNFDNNFEESFYNYLEDSFEDNLNVNPTDLTPELTSDVT